jgi:DNA topoisomerase III
MRARNRAQNFWFPPRISNFLFFSSTDFPSNFGWNVDPRILFDAPVEKIEANDKAHVPKHLKNEAHGCDALILWLDNDREGENICFEVIDTVVHKLNRPHQILRAKFSAVTKQDIDRAMKNLGPPNKNEALAVDARQELDLKVGVAFTRFQTGWFHYKVRQNDISKRPSAHCSQQPPSSMEISIRI